MRIAYIILVVLTGAVCWFLGTQYGVDKAIVSSQSPASETEVVEPPPTIHAQGKLEPKSGVVRIVAPPGEKIDSLFERSVGDPVKIDDNLVQLDSRRVRQKELELAIARKADAEAQAQFEKEQGEFKRQAAQLAVQQALANRSEIENKSKNIPLLQKQRETAGDVLGRLRTLGADPVTRQLINQTDIEKQQLLVDQLDVQIEQAKTELELASEKISRGQQAAEIDLKTVEFSLQQYGSAIPKRSMETAIQAATMALDATEIKSPINGTILDIIVREGDTVANLPVMLLGDTSEMHCIAEVNDSQMRFVKEGAKAMISSSALEQPIYGTVKSKGIMIGPPSMKDPNPFGSVDRKTGKIVIVLDDADVARKFVNLQVDVAIELTPGALAE